MNVFLSRFAKNSRSTVLHGLRKAADGMGYQNIPLEGVPWDRIGASEIVQLVQQWRGTVSGASIRIYIFAVRGVIESCVKHHLVDPSQFEPIRVIRVPKPIGRDGLGRYIDEKDRRQILRSCDTDERQLLAKRDKAMLSILFGSGLHRAEATQLEIQDIDLTEATFTIIARGHRSVEKYLAAWSIAPLREWIRELAGQGITSGPLLRRISKGGRPLSKLSPNGLWRALGQRCIYAGVRTIKPHDARQTLGADLISQHGLMTAKLALGHSDVMTTTTYAVTSREEMKSTFRHKFI
ncbi:tyrosine-type recombinase/integrase [Pseudomonas viciae]|uniref:tyrosine-type recombinase/integrase n=1 Tax=Pseudomonas viciae TaxID=2505979 RepID=UPI002234C9AD|nr:site-specific integrase [Pseudomonas viciae]UZE83997.1 site-specific integrase [Pseudomonas viciae]